MIGTGTLANVAAIIVGGFIGMLIKKGLNDRLQNTLMQAMGIAVIFIGFSGAMPGMLTFEDGKLTTTSSLPMIISMALGALTGELINIEDKLERFGVWLKSKVDKNGTSPFVDGFVNTSLVVCIGAMAVVGALQDGLGSGADTLYAKALIDGVILIVFGAAYGKGALFAALPVGLWQGFITIIAGLIAPYVSQPILDNLSYIGSILIACVGINLCFKTKLRVANFLPALIFGVIFTVLL